MIHYSCKQDITFAAYVSRSYSNPVILLTFFTFFSLCWLVFACTINVFQRQENIIAEENRKYLHFTCGRQLASLSCKKKSIAHIVKSILKMSSPLSWNSFISFVPSFLMLSKFCNFWVERGLQKPNERNLYPIRVNDMKIIFSFSYFTFVL